MKHLIKRSREVLAGVAVNPIFIRAAQLSTVLVFAVAANAQDPFTGAATQVSVAGVNVVRLIGVVFLGGGGITMLMDHNHGVGAKLTSMGLGAVFVFAPTQIAAWAQSTL